MKGTNGRPAAFWRASEPPRRTRLERFLCRHLKLLGALSLVWLALRSGRKPSRLNYPCQRAARSYAALLFAGTALPAAARLPRRIFGDHLELPLGRKVSTALQFTAVALLAVAVIFAGRGGQPHGRSLEAMRSVASGLAAPVLRSDDDNASSIYVAEGVPRASEEGVDALINVMDANGLDFFEAAGAGKAAGPDGVIGADDTVLIKVNGEWRGRGGTNTDVVKGLVNGIVHHPDGFTGEVVIVENGQWDSYMDNRADNRNPDGCNAEDVTQSFNDVALVFAGRHRVSVYDWTAIQTRSVAEFASGDTSDGYVYMPEIELGYPKFTTIYGTRISLRHGLWNGSAYDNGNVKLINVPVLKDHALAGVTCCVKHFMGVQDLWRGTSEAPHTPMISEGILARLMLAARYPDLNVVDAIWVTPAGGPSAPYERAVRVDKLLASTDPIALDYYCAKNVLLPLSGNARHDPDNPDGATNAFRQMLTSSSSVLAAGGKRVTSDPARMNVYTGWTPQPPPATAYEYLLAEGSTAHGFETWILVANPGDEEATVYVSYLTGGGCRNREPLVVPPGSRVTLNASSDLWSTDAGIRVGCDRPVHVERAMYWGERTEGHVSHAAIGGAKRWYLADGHTAGGFETWIEILNPAAAETEARLTYMTPGGTVPGPIVSVPAYSRRTIFVADTVKDSDVSAVVESDAPVVAERSMYWNGKGGGSGSMGVEEPSVDWHFAEGCTAHGFETYILLLNHGPAEAEVTLQFAARGVQAGRAGSKAVAVPAGHRVTVKVNDVLPDADVSTTVRSSAPVVAERSMLWAVPGGRAGHSASGTASPEREMFLTEGCTAHGFETWLTVQNPGERTARVKVYAMTGEGQRRLDGLELAPREGRTLRLNDYFEGNLSVRVTADEPVVCERAVYWNGRRGGTCSQGEAAARR
jgi:hypothetical protein